jgi:hypothetical protein
MAFSPGGAYFLTTQIQTQVGSSTQSVLLNIVSAAAPGTPVTRTWNPISNPAEPDADPSSSFWGFSPDEQSFSFVSLGPDGIATLELIALPSGASVQQFTFTNSVASYVQFAPCGEVMALVDQITDPFSVTADNPVTISLYSTKASDARKGAIGSKGSLPVGDIDIEAGPSNYTATVKNWPDTIVLATNTAAGNCAPPTTTGPGGGSGAPSAAKPPHFKDGEVPDLPHATPNEPYSYTFDLEGYTPITFKLTANNCGWVSLSADGELSGTPLGAMTCSIAIDAENDVGSLQQEFNLTVDAPASASATSPATARRAAGLSASAPADTPSNTVTPSTLLLPGGRGQIVLPEDVTPAVSTFTYTETDAPTGPVGGLTFAALGFTLTAVDADSGAPVTTLVDPPRAMIVLRPAELRAARITNPSTLGLYWWDGTKWVNQLPCDGCGLDLASGVFYAALTQLGEYMLAANQPPPVVTVVAAPIAATAGAVFSGTVATFAPSSPLDPLGSYAAIVRWGDGQVSQGAIAQPTAGTFVISGVHTWSAPGTYTVGLTVLNGGTISVGQGTAVVTPPVMPPQFTSATPPLSATQGVLYSYAFAATGVPAPSFALAAGSPGWLTIGAASGVVSGTPPAGTTTFSYTVLASNGVSPDASAGPFGVAVAPALAAPKFTSATPPLTTAPGVVYSYTFAATGVPAPAFSFAPGAPAWLSIGAATGVLTGTPPSGTTSFTYTVRASNGVSPDATAGPFTVIVNSSPRNAADLEVSLSAPATAARGTIVTYTVTVTNHGPSAAMNGLVALAAGPDADLISASPRLFINLDCLWMWTFSKIDAGASATFTVRARLDRSGIVVGSVVVGSETPDPLLNNNVAAVKTVIR